MSNSYKLLIEFSYKRREGLFKSKDTPYPIQGLYYNYGFKITNIGKNSFPGGEIQNVKIKYLSTDTSQISPDVHMLPQLEPEKSIIINTNRTIFDIPGPIWVSCAIKPNEGQIETYQCSKGKDNYVSLSSKNSWSNSEFVVPHMEHIQSNTNAYIILLTIVTLVIGIASLFIG